MLVYIRREEMRDAGKSETEIQAAIDKGYADGTFKAPTQPGIIYMMSCENRLGPDPRTGRPASFPPHVMFYAPYMTAKDLGYGGDPADALSRSARDAPGDDDRNSRRGPATEMPE
jgi:hypothetical protein